VPAIATCPGDITITNKLPAIFSFTGNNGSFTDSLNQRDLTWSLGSGTNTLLFSIGNNNSGGILQDFGVLKATSGPGGTPEETYPIEVILTDGGGLQAPCSFNVTYVYTPSVTFGDNTSTLVLTNSEGAGGGNRSVTYNGSFTIANAPVGNVPFQIRGNTTGSGTVSFLATYFLVITGPSPSTTTTTISTATEGAPAQTATSSATSLGNGDYTFVLTVASANFPSIPVPTTAVATIIQPY
jgi:hypothetical protein